MGKETDNIFELLQQWRKYTSRYEPDLRSFGKWLSEQADVSGNQGEEKVENTPFKERYINDTVPLEDQIVLHWGRLQRFTHLWSRKAMKNLPIRSIEEFGLIKSVELMGSVRKSDLVRYTLLETTTCFEMIKRLVRAGYMHEEIDPDDRRSRKVMLTARGKSLSAESETQLRQLSRLLIGNINSAQKQALLEVIRELDDFHGRLYLHHAEASLSGMLDWLEDKR